MPNIHISGILARFTAFVLLLICVALFWGSLLMEQQEVNSNRQQAINQALEATR